MGKSIEQVLVALLVLAGAIATIVTVGPRLAAQESTLGQLEKKFQKQYASIQKHFAEGPEDVPSRPYTASPVDNSLERIAAERRERVGEWQDELAARFARAAATADEIIKLQPANLERWREQRETLLLYAQPVSPPETRTVFGDREVERRARVFKQPLAVYPDEARTVNAKGEVRLRLVLDANGTVKYIFPIKPAKHGLTEAAIEAARRIEFEPAIRNGHRASQFVTFVYKFEDGQSLTPFTPPTIF